MTAKHNRIAMSLIEVTIAMAIIAMVIASSIGAMGTAHDVNRRSRGEALALAEIQNQIEQIQATDFTSVNDLFATTSTVTFPVTGLSQATGTSQVGSITKDAASTGSLLCLRFAITWQDRQGPTSVQATYWHINRGN